MNKKCYNSGQITGLESEVYTKNFDEADQAITEIGLNPINPLKLPHIHSKTWEEYMKEDIKAMMDCNVIYLQKNSNQSRGSEIEETLAKELGFYIIRQQ